MRPCYDLTKTLLGLYRERLRRGDPGGGIIYFCFIGGSLLLPGSPRISIIILISWLACCRCLRNKRPSEPHAFKGFGAVDVTKPGRFIWSGDFHGPKPYKFMGFGAATNHRREKTFVRYLESDPRRSEMRGLYPYPEAPQTGKPSEKLILGPQQSVKLRGHPVI